MTMQIAPARPSLAMYGKSLAETTAIKSWMARRIGQTAIPPSSLRRDVQGLGAASVQASAYARGQASPWPGQGRGPKQWPVARYGNAPGAVPAFGDTVGVKDWDMRRIWKKRIPASSLMGLGELGAHVSAVQHTGTKAERTWGINPLSETTYVENTAPRRVGMDRYYADDAWHEQAQISGFGAFGALDAQVSVRDWQTALRKLGICQSADGRAMSIDGLWGPITQSASDIALRTLLGLSGAAGFVSSIPRGTTLNTTAEIWTHLQSLAEGRIDQCGGTRTSTSTGTTTTTGGGTTTGSGADTTGGGGATDTTGSNPPADTSAGITSSPWFWLGVAAAVGVGAYMVMSKDGSEQPEETFLIPDPSF
jgi:hypothetical protein